MQAPAFLANRAGRGLNMQAVQGIGGPQPPRISINANRFTLIDAAGNQRPHVVTMVNPATGHPQQFIAPYIDLVIIGVNPSVSKVFYDTAYDPNAEEGPPACFSDNGVGPSTMATKPQAPTCASCPNNVWGSAVSNMTGKQVKACTDAKKIAVILPGDPILYQFRIPPATLKALKAYAHTVGGHSITGPDGRTRGADFSDIITRVEFEGQGILKFTPISFIDEGLAAHMDAMTQDKLDVVLGLNDKPYNPNQLPQAAAPAQLMHQPAPQQMMAPPQYAPQALPPTPVHAPQPVYAPPPPAMPQPTVMQPVAQPQPTYAPPAQFVAAQPVQLPPGAAPGQPVAANGAAEPAKQRRGRGRPAMTAQAPMAQPQPAPAQAGPVVVQGPPAMMVPGAMQPAPAPAQPMAQPAMPPAQQWTPPPVAAPPGAPAPAPTQFGMQQAPAPVPDAAMQAAVLDAMNFKA